ncbi:DUF1080 domain-containing protein [Algibacter sp. 2305UL17-15]|uniref:3-keto-disaccharide hydrolase n=1 Tax=Algibacter sp. 2305UL17-15 TaxID=3231268 RepID=UPI00345A98D0
MTKKILFYIALLLIFSCAKDEKKPIKDAASIEQKEETTLPFTHIELNDMSAFKPTAKNWQIVGNPVADRVKKGTFTSTKGTGILLNTPNENTKDNLFTNFEHGDIELELDVMMPLESNSGIYFQGRYEIQLFDSWGVTKPKYNDIGGIYQRWNKDAEKGKEGFEGHAPKVNAAKAPGLWQHLKVIFHAPKFDAEGHKTKNAWFEEVRLNGMLLHENAEVTGPTRAAAFGDEKPLAPLMIQGDHGAVAFKNIKYKRYNDTHIKINEAVLKIYDNTVKQIPITHLDSLKLLEEHKTDAISPLENMGRNDQKVLVYSGTLNIPTTGTYIFDATVNGSTVLIIGNDTIIGMNADFDMNTTKYEKVNLKEGNAHFQLLYNKPFPWRNGFDLFVEGPSMQRYSFLKDGTSILNKNNPINPIVLDVKDTPLTQRSFIGHKGVKRTHCISVGLVEGMNYTLDLATGSLLHVWSGDFFDATQMWHSRGEHQRGKPMGFVVSSHGDLDYAPLNDEDDTWPKVSDGSFSFKSSGYTFDVQNIPTFSYKLDEAEITDRFVAASQVKRGLERTISSNSSITLWHKIADGTNIKPLPDHTFIINDESYYIVIPEHNAIKTVVRSSNGKDELLVKIPKGNQTFKYRIIW